MELDTGKNLGKKDREHIFLYVCSMSTLSIFLALSWLRTSFYNVYNILEQLMHLMVLRMFARLMRPPC